MDNAKTIEEHNAKHLGWTMDVNEYADLSWEEFKTLKVGGFRPDLARQPWKLHGHLSYAEEAACQSFLCRRKRILSPILLGAKTVLIFSLYQRRTEGAVTPVKNQGQWHL